MNARTKQTTPANSAKPANSANNCALDNSLIAGLSKALNPLNAVDEVIDMFKETASAARNLFNKPDDPERQFEFALCVVGWIPGPGMGLKFAFKQMLKKPDLFVPIVTTIMMHFKATGDWWVWFDDYVNANKIKEILGKAKGRVKDALKVKTTKQTPQQGWAGFWNSVEEFATEGVINPTIDYSIEVVFDKGQRYIPAIVKVLSKKLAPIKTAAKNQTVAACANPNKAKKTSTSTTNTITTAPPVVKDNGKTGVVGEHMGDYWVAEQLKLGAKAKHDDGQKVPGVKLGNLKKLTDGSHLMTKLTSGARGTGLDSLWLTNTNSIGGMRTQKYAIVEYKASAVDELKQIGSLLKKLRATKLPATTAQPEQGGKRQKGQTDKAKKDDDGRYPMSRKWTHTRLESWGHGDKKSSTSRHLIFFGSKAIEQHQQALAKKPKNPNPVEHTNHEVTIKFNEEDIEKNIADKKQRAAAKLECTKPTPTPTPTTKANKTKK